jgi:hypothetical protein
MNTPKVVILFIGAVGLIGYAVAQFFFWTGSNRKGSLLEVLGYILGIGGIVFAMIKFLELLADFQSH